MRYLRPKHIFLPSLLLSLMCAPLAVQAAGSAPFLSQAPFGEWGDPRQAEGCEEAAALMAAAWASRTPLPARTGRSQIIAISEWERQQWGFYQDTSAEDTATILTDNLGVENVDVQHGITTAEIRNAIADGAVVIVPINGRKLGSPFYRSPGPRHHTILIYGYDATRGQFLVNDPGTRRGAANRYSAARIQAALRDYPSGVNAPDPSVPSTAMVVIRPS